MSKSTLQTRKHILRIVAQDPAIRIRGRMAGKHGSVDRGTEVPRSKLVEALKGESDFFSTQELRKKDELKKAFTISL
jgi:hypothetical protein